MNVKKWNKATDGRDGNWPFKNNQHGSRKLLLLSGAMKTNEEEDEEELKTLNKR